MEAYIMKKQFFSILLLMSLVGSTSAAFIPKRAPKDKAYYEAQLKEATQAQEIATDKTEKAFYQVLMDDTKKQIAKFDVQEAAQGWNVSVPSQKQVGIAAAAVGLGTVAYVGYKYLTSGSDDDGSDRSPQFDPNAAFTGQTQDADVLGAKKWHRMSRHASTLAVETVRALEAFYNDHIFVQVQDEDGQWSADISKQFFTLAGVEYVDELAGTRRQLENESDRKKHFKAAIMSLKTEADFENLTITNFGQDNSDVEINLPRNIKVTLRFEHLTAENAEEIKANIKKFAGLMGHTVVKETPLFNLTADYLVKQQKTFTANNVYLNLQQADASYEDQVAAYDKFKAVRESARTAVTAINAELANLKKLTKEDAAAKAEAERVEAALPLNSQTGAIVLAPVQPKGWFAAGTKSRKTLVSGSLFAGITGAIYGLSLLSK